MQQKVDLATVVAALRTELPKIIAETELPQRPQRLIRKAELPEYVGVNRTAIQEMIADGSFPKPIKLTAAGRHVAWLESDIVAWQLKRAAERDATT
jgi:prophage regulatory protein